jgi:ribose transport system substrate-binding protein
MGLAAVAALAVLAMLVLAACGESDSSGGGDNAGDEAVAGYQQRLEKLYESTYTKPTGPAVKAAPDKNVWVVSVGQNIETAQRASGAMEAAGDALGWEVTTFDGKFDPTRQLAGVEQALADRADGIVLLYIDCATVKTGLQRAEEQGVPTVAIEGLDCDPGLWTHRVLYADDQSYNEWVMGWGAAQAAWVIAKTKGDAKTILNTETDLELTRLQTVGIKQEFDKCPTCEIVDDAQFVGSDFGPRLQEKIEQAFVAHPEANSFIAAYDAALTTGGANAIKSTGRLDEIHVMGGEGSTPGIKLIYDDAGMDACSGIDTGQEGYGAIDALVRVFAGGDPAESNTGIGWQICDREHNLPPEGEAYSPPIDYEAAYEEFWGVG